MKLTNKIIIGALTSAVLFSGCGTHGCSTSVPDSPNKFAYSVITSPTTGKVWMDRNLGACRVCESIDDEQCFGDYYQWGRDADGHQIQGSDIAVRAVSSLKAKHSDFIIPKYNKDWTTTDQSGNYRSKNWNPCPAGFRVPTIKELEAEYIETKDDAFINLRLPAAGHRSYQYGQMDEQGDEVKIWSNTNEAESLSRYLSVEYKKSFLHYGSRAYGMPVRCIEK